MAKNKLFEIQQRLKAPKGQYNKFGKYSYRSCEDILEAVKPILEDLECTLVIWDDIVLVGDRYYVKATARLRGEGTDEIVTAWARESDTKSGMDSSQITGATSSYARKYALNGLFCIDDNKDADTDEYANQNSKKPVTIQASAEQPKDKEAFNSAHPDWNKVLNNLANGKGSIKALQDYYSISASVEKEIMDYLNQHLKQV